MNKYGTGGWAFTCGNRLSNGSPSTWNHFTKHCESIVSPNRQVNIRLVARELVAATNAFRI